ncbi:hypothetical protein [Microbispora bryophytorum]|uniref:Uncharacterized protein n=1 Tax=Microbispora bryophytorum TaxID=1460882 RepID=A0A8H9LCX6_9ACTN|nr:hypothetical protein [Microbispora bryophytorum]MBD3137418.1 hypothetical protein [Microbispora bryophytorum]TQS06856.1 hypothetical protein FLX07_13445 [Microbispora bryophytorum]GGO08496.1 hypothetical protein GCM10011574_23080 [Microbispora bryophytorum]
MSNESLKLDLRGLDVDSIDVLSADSIVAEGHGAVETGASSAAGYCSSYLSATSCWAPEA